MKNHLTLVIDGGWFLMSRFGGMAHKFTIDNPNIDLVCEDFIDMLSRSFVGILYKIPGVDNVVMTMEGGSWRKDVSIPEQLGKISYKGNRDPDRDKYDWPAIYKSFDRFVEELKELGVTVSRGYGIEGDDWMWYWSRRLNENGTNVIIWTSDGDIKQLVQVGGGTFTAWYNEKAGLFLPKECEKTMDLLELQLFNIDFMNPVLDEVRKKLGPENYINPAEIVMQKTISGDMSDNIKSCARVEKKGRTYGIGEKTCKCLLNSCGSPQSVQDFINRFDMISCEIPRTLGQFKECNSTLIREMLDYNLKLVWLSNETIPQKYLDVMNEQEYAIADIKMLKEEGYSKIKSMQLNEHIDVDVDDLFNS